VEWDGGLGVEGDGLEGEKGGEERKGTPQLLPGLAPLIGAPDTRQGSHRLRLWQEVSKFGAQGLKLDI